MVKFILSFVFIVLIASFSISTVETMPSNAVIYVNMSTKKYISPPCLNDSNKYIFLFKTVKSDVGLFDLSPDSSCRDEGGFVGNDRILLFYVLEKIGILNKRTRWNDGGGWNW